MVGAACGDFQQHGGGLVRGTPDGSCVMHDVSLLSVGICCLRTKAGGRLPSGAVFTIAHIFPGKKYCLFLMIVSFFVQMALKGNRTNVLWQIVEENQ